MLPNAYEKPKPQFPNLFRLPLALPTKATATSPLYAAPPPPPPPPPASSACWLLPTDGHHRAAVHSLHRRLYRLDQPPPSSSRLLPIDLAYRPPLCCCGRRMRSSTPCYHRGTLKHSFWNIPVYKKMLAGIKFIPRAQVDTSSARGSSDSGSSSRERRESRSKEKRDDKKRRKKTYHDSSEDDDNNKERLKGRTRRMGRTKRKASYSSNDDDTTSESMSECRSDSEDEKRRRKKRSKEKRSSNSSGEDVFSHDGDDIRRHTRKKRHAKGKRKKIREDNEDLSNRDKELMRKQMGLDWMFKPKDASERRAAEPDDAHEKPDMEEVKRPNPRELNPYLKDNGSGFPDESHTMNSSSALPSSSVVGDGGASWRLKALKRAQEQAARDGRKLDDIVEERWGSLGQLAASVASHRAAHTHAHLHSIKDRRRAITETSEAMEHDQNKRGTGEASTARRDYLQDVSSRHPEMKKPKQDSYAWRKKTNNSFPGDNPIISDALYKLNKFENDGSFMDEMIHQQSEYANASCTDPVDREVHEQRAAEAGPPKTIKSDKEHLVGMQGLTANQLAAKALQLRLKGKHEEAEKLLKQTESVTDNQVSRAKAFHQETEGNTSRYARRGMPSKLKKAEDDADLNLAQKIIQNRRYSISGQADDEYDFDEAPTRKRNKKMEVVAEEKHNLAKRILTQQERCQFCFENPARAKHLVISIANFAYVILPQWEPVVQGHCCILPLQHEASTRTVDDNVWEEIRNYKKCLIMMFAKQDKDVLFLETVIGLSKQRRHCLVECIPLPRELAKEAPLYFKKAIDESADEWSQHHAKRLIETTSQKGLRRSIPKDFPYFHVEFGLDRGFVHVIDDEGKFKSSLGLNVIRGMLRLPEEDMYRRRRHEPIEKQRSAVASFAREWEPFDWTKQLN